MQTKIPKLLFWFVLIALISSACGGKPTTPPPTPVPPTPLPAPTATPEPPPAPKGGGEVSELQGVKSAVIQIEAQGTFVNPDFSVAYNVAGRGSGFIIASAGIAVTNNHVVTGAGLLKIWVGGNKDKTYNAKVLGVSECSDLAVIDIEGDGFPYLGWHDGAINVGLDVYAAGFPLGDPEYTLTRGIVSKERADGESSWASVDYVIEHDATINPGNSGGPLVDASGKVVGVNYAGSSETNQYFAIGRDLVQDVVEHLRTGENLDTLGVNGEAYSTADFSGVWVYSVKSGSPADKAGVQGGDIITTLEDLVLSTDGTMADYCDILRSHSADDVLKIEVLRYATSEVLRGQINGDELQQVFSFEQNLEETTGQEIPQTAPEDVYTDYVNVTDDANAIQMSIPVEWTDVNGSAWVDNGDVIGAAISASPNLDAFNNTWTESGVFFGASDDLARLGGYVQLLDINRDNWSSSCDIEGRYDYEDAVFYGKYDVFTNCGGEDTIFLVLTAVPFDNPESMLILVQVQIVKDADLDALDNILATFDVIGTLP